MPLGPFTESQTIARKPSLPVPTVAWPELCKLYEDWWFGRISLEEFKKFFTDRGVEITNAPAETEISPPEI